MAVHRRDGPNVPRRPANEVEIRGEGKVGYAHYVERVYSEIDPDQLKFVTSRPYPVNVTEALGYDGQPLDGAIRNSHAYSGLDGLNYSAAPLNGELRELLIRYAYIEGMEYAAEPLDGELREILKRYGYTEGMEYAALPLDGELRAILIRYTCEPEGLNYSAAPMSGTLEAV